MITTQIISLRETQRERERCLLNNHHVKGAITIRVSELDGSYDHVVAFEDMMHVYDFQCYSRLRKNKRKRISYTNGDEIEIDLSKRYGSEHESERSEPAY
jgi:hypothetical protein